jgi:hypothetical protein
MQVKSGQVIITTNCSHQVAGTTGKEGSVAEGQPARKAIHPTSDSRSVNVQVLCEIRGLSEAKIDKCLDAAKKVVQQHGWQSATQYASKVSLLKKTCQLEL